MAHVHWATERSPWRSSKHHVQRGGTGDCRGAGAAAGGAEELPTWDEFQEDKPCQESLSLDMCSPFLTQKAYCMSEEGQDRAGKPLKALSREMQRLSETSAVIFRSREVHLDGWSRGL